MMFKRAALPIMTQAEQDVFQHKVRDVLGQVRRELRRSAQEHPPMYNAEEGLSVIWDTTMDLWDQIKAGHGKHKRAADDAIRIAAMAIRYVLDVTEEENKEPTNEKV